MNAICLTIDRLHIGYLGTYGNAWIETPSLDRLACESFVFDQALIAGPRTESFYRHVWRGRHPAIASEAPGPNIDLPEQLTAAGVKTVLLTDDVDLAASHLTASFNELVELDPPETIETARDVGETHLARCFARIIDWLDTAKGPFLLWVHLAGLGACWDAPYVFRERYVEPGDPDPPDTADVPSLELDEDFDPDVLLGITQSYAGQVTLLDVCLGALLESLDENPAGQETLLALLSSRGFPLGEHRSVGASDDSLHGELVHVPMMIRLPDRLGEADRSQAIVTPADLRATLADCLLPGASAENGLGQSLLPIIRGETETIRDRWLLGDHDAETAIRTTAWHMRLLDEPQLYVKPDDRWEINDVADRCPEIVEELREVAEDYRVCLETGRPDSAMPLSEVLRSGLE